jgi:hypothetical protein
MTIYDIICLKIFKCKENKIEMYSIFPGCRWATTEKI